MKKIIICWIVIIISVITMIITGGYLFKYYSDSVKAENTNNEVKELIDEPEISILDENETIDASILKEIYLKKFNDIKTENEDFVGWINIPDTKIDYPVMHTPNDEEFYLHRNFYKTYDYAGVPFCSADSNIEKPSDNIIIYGHHMQVGTMFTDLVLFKDEEFYKQHKTFTFDTIYRSGIYEIVGVFLTDVNPGTYPYYEVHDCDKETFDEYIKYMRDHSIYNIDTNVEYGDKLVSLSTCEYHTTNGRLVVVGKLIETNDELLIIN